MYWLFFWKHHATCWSDRLKVQYIEMHNNYFLQKHKVSRKNYVKAFLQSGEKCRFQVSICMHPLQFDWIPQCTSTDVSTYIHIFVIVKICTFCLTHTCNLNNSNECYFNLDLNIENMILISFICHLEIFRSLQYHLACTKNLCNRHDSLWYIF